MFENKILNSRDKTDLDMFEYQIARIQYMESELNFFLGIREIIEIEDVEGETNLFMCDYQKNLKCNRRKKRKNS